VLAVETLETRLVPTLQLLYQGPGSVLSLTESSAGNDNVVISEPTPGRLRIDLGTATLAATSSTAFGLTYEIPGSPATSHFADVNIAAVNAVSALSINLGAGSDGLTVGDLANAARGITNITVTDSVGSNTLIDLKSISLSGGNLDVSGGPIRVLPGATVATQGGLLSLRGFGGTHSIGVDVNGATLDSGASQLFVQGGGGSTGDSYGVYVHGGAVLTGNSAVVTGRGGIGASTTRGVYVADPGSSVSSRSGLVGVTGTGGSDASGPSIGVVVENGATIQSSAGGPVFVTGTGGLLGDGSNNAGVVVRNTAGNNVSARI